MWGVLCVTEIVMYTPPTSTHTNKEYGLEHGNKVPIGFYIEEFHLDMLPLDNDLLSLDINTAFTVSSHFMYSVIFLFHASYGHGMGCMICKGTANTTQ